MLALVLPVDLAACLAVLFSGLVRVMVPIIRAQGAAEDLTRTVFLRMSFGMRLFARLELRFRAGLPGVRRPRAAGSGGRGRGRSKPLVDLPRDGGWLVRLMPAMADYAARLGALVSGPEAEAAVAAMIAAAPSTRALLRALWTMLRTDPMPAVLRAPRREPAAGGSAAAAGEVAGAVGAGAVGAGAVGAGGEMDVAAPPCEVDATERPPVAPPNRSEVERAVRARSVFDPLMATTAGVGQRFRWTG